MGKKNTVTEKTKDYISQSLLILMGKKPFTDISIGEITDKAGVNRSTYYRNFISKESIIKYYFNKIIYEYLEEIQNKDTIILKDYLLKMFSHFYEYKKQLLLIHKNRLSYLILETLGETFITINKKSTFEESYKIYYHTGGIYNTFLLWFSDEMNASPEQMSKLALTILPKYFRPQLL